MKIKDELSVLEVYFRQYGYEGEDVFISLTSYYLLKHEICEGSKNMLFFKKKGDIIISKINADAELCSKLDNIVKYDLYADILPIAYQFFLSKKYRDTTGKYFTPKDIAESMAKVLKIKSGATILDPTCGGGTFLVSALKRWGNEDVHLIGNDIDKSLLFMAETIIRINNKDKNHYFDFLNYNFYSEYNKFSNLFGKVDYILANPPFSIPIKSLEVNSPLFDLGYKNSDAIFIDLCFNLLKKDGKLVCLVPHSLVSNKDYENFRIEIEKRWQLQGVFILSEGVFNTTSNTTTRPDILVLNKGKINSKMVFANISDSTTTEYFKQRNIIDLLY